MSISGDGSSRLLLVPSFTELEWGIRSSLEEWAEVATFDAPGIGDTETPFEVELDAIGPENHDRRISK